MKATLKRATQVVVATSAAVVLALGGISPANAEVVLGQETFQVTRTSPECLAQLPAGEDPALCTATEDWLFSAEMQYTTPTDPTFAAPIVDSDQAGFEAALTAGSVRYRNFTNTVTGGAYTVQMTGRFYFDGARVWVNTRYRNATGWVNCTTIYASWPTNITNMVERDQGGTSYRTVSCNYNVNWLNPLYQNWFSYAWGVSRTVRANGTTG